MNLKQPYENRMAPAQQNRMQRLHRNGPGTSHENAILHVSENPAVHAIKSRYKLLARGIDPSLPASLRAARQRQLDVEMLAELNDLEPTSRKEPCHVL